MAYQSRIKVTLICSTSPRRSRVGFAPSAMLRKLASGVWVVPMRKPLKPKRIHERAHQYRVIAERLQFQLDRENLPPKEAELVRTAQQALARAADVVEKSASDA
jgi:hypothetical protein